MSVGCMCDCTPNSELYLQLLTNCSAQVLLVVEESKLFAHPQRSGSTRNTAQRTRVSKQCDAGAKYSAKSLHYRASKVHRGKSHNAAL
eukprot:scaffold30901_cov89-Skeletonema_dohrnii-CCMP3373.AAC.2